MVSRFAVGHDVEAFALFVFRYPQANDHIDDLVADEGDDAGPEDDRADTLGVTD